MTCRGCQIGVPKIATRHSTGTAEWECTAGQERMTYDEASRYLVDHSRGTIGEYQDAQEVVVAAGHTVLVPVNDFAWIEKVRKLRERVASLESERTKR